MALVLYLSILLNEKQQKKKNDYDQKSKLNFFFFNFKVSATESDF